MHPEITPRTNSQLPTARPLQVTTRADKGTLPVIIAAQFLQGF
jgi:hypothetical protein